jgi:hypothetical protein
MGLHGLEQGHLYFLLYYCFQTGCGIHPTSYAMGALSPGVKQAGREADHSPSSDGVENSGATPPFPIIGDNFTYYLL